MNIFSPEKAIDALVAGLRKFVERAGAQKVVVGLSGGVDSAVTLALAVRALGKEQVLPILIPFSRFSSEQNLSDAKMLATLLDCPFRIISLDEFVSPFEKNLSETQNKHVLGNVLARLRMTILYGIANAENGLVLGTCNKTETLLGYETKFGDGAADISVIGALWKTEVWEVAKALALPEIFITKTPSAELWESHTDEGELGFSYATADSILQKLENGEELEETVETEKIKRLVAKNRHKHLGIPLLVL